MSQLYFFLSDRFFFPLFEVCFLVLFMYALLREKRWLRSKDALETTIKRGEKSWTVFDFAFGILSVVLMQIINCAETLFGYKTFISIMNILMLLYLVYWNSWFRNGIINLVYKCQNKPETL